ncbi:MAG: DUF5995 family protein [Bacteroidia bacterium]
MQQHINSWEQSRDKRHIFLSCYRMMTANMLEAVQKGEFQDREWVDKLLHRFADYYFDALACFDCGDDVPAVWQQVHAKTREEKLHILQYLFLGINAHINYDLVLTLRDMLQPEWHGLSETERNLRYADHCKVNEVIAATIDQVQDEIIEPRNAFMAFIDRAFGRLDEYLLSGSSQAGERMFGKSM